MTRSAATVREWIARLWATLHPSRRDSDLEEELRLHLEMATEEERRRLHSAENARHAAVARVGGVAQTMENLRDQRGLPWFENLMRDLRYACRMLMKSPGFTAVAVLTLAFGIGANATLFSLVDALLFRHLSVAEPTRLVFVQRTAGKTIAFRRAQIEALRNLRTTFSDVAMYASVPEALVTIDSSLEADRLVVRATDNFFGMLGLRATVGHLDTNSSSDDPAAVISDRFWKARFHGDPQVLGHALSVNDVRYRIIGVAPPGFQGMSLDASVNAWVFSSTPAFVAPLALARLQPAVSVEQAQAASTAILQNLDKDQGLPGNAGSVLTQVLPAGHGDSNLREEFRRPLIALTALVTLVLLVTCTNIGNLMIVRNTERVHELSVRTSLGARRAQLVSQLLIESGVIAAIGTAAAWLLARWGVSTLLAMLPVTTVPEQLEFHTDVRMLGFMALLSLVSVGLFGFAPAWRATRVDVAAALKATQTTATSRGTRRLGLWLVAAQVALSIVLLTGAGLFLQTLRNMAHVNLGFAPRNLLQVELTDRLINIQPGEVPGLLQRLVDSVAAVPGVQAVTPLRPFLFPAWAVGGPEPAATSGAGAVGDSDFFEVLRIPLVRGRLFTRDDMARSESVAVVSESYARQFFPGEEVIGKRAGPFHLEVVGVVGDAKLFSIRWHDYPMMYRLGLREGRLTSALLARTTADPTLVVRAVQQAVSSVNPRLFGRVTPVDDLVNRSMARERMVATASACFGVLGLVLSGIGLFGIVAFTVVQRTSELGLRMVLGASGRDVVYESLRDTMRVCGVGLVAGSVAAVAGARLAGGFISGLLFGLEATDWANVGGAVAVMVIIAVTACLVPALRATRINPLAAIRYQ